MIGDRPRPGPYESSLNDVVHAASALWWPETTRELAVGCPVWLAVLLAEETGAYLQPSPGAECELRLGPVRVFGSRRLSGPLGGFVVQDLISGWSYRSPLRCHRDLPPSAWLNFTAAVADGLAVATAVDLVGLVDAI